MSLNTIPGSGKSGMSRMCCLSASSSIGPFTLAQSGRPVALPGFRLAARRYELVTLRVNGDMSRTVPTATLR